MSRIGLAQVVEAVNDLPSLPQIIDRVVGLVDNPNSTAQDINDIITRDQSLTAKVLRLANSAHYGYPRRISTVTEATVLLGFSTVKSMVMAASVSDLMAREMPGYALAPGELWRHSQGAAITSRFIARRLGFGFIEVAYTAALLHDIGKVILNHHLEQSYREVVELIKGNRMSFAEAEKEVLGFDHAEVGSRVAEKWNLPPELVEAIACHHKPEEAVQTCRLTAIVHTADALCMMLGVGLGLDGLDYRLSEPALKELGLDLSEVENLISLVGDNLADESSFLK